MSLEIRKTNDPSRVDLYEGDEKIGQITCEPPDADDPTDTAPPYHHAELLSATGSGKTWHADSEDPEEILRYAHEMYEEWSAERAELRKGRVWTTGSIPMGGQPGWRRR
ncbi:hypothetical protein ACIBAC_11820 [Streptomyces sp. NPDC051362]|uniref:hypothetical protein n=1 Tax=Streptomyces sp. NPDC051362 TaxID=3365651 RepID=UPI0037AEC76F